jgi:hypothetical protein
MELVDLDLYGVILVGTIGGRGAAKDKDVVRIFVTNADCDSVGYVVAGGQDSASTLRRKKPMRGRRFRYAIASKLR